MKKMSDESEESDKESEESEVSEESEKEYTNFRSAVKEEKKEQLDLLFNQWDNGNSLNLSGNGNSMNISDNDDFQRSEKINFQNKHPSLFDANEQTKRDENRERANSNLLMFYKKRF